MLMYHKATFLFILGVILIPFGIVQAASLSIVAPQSVPPEQNFTIHVSLIPDGSNINALEGALKVPREFLISDIYERNSIIPLWIERPHEVTSSSVWWSGIIPGGFSGLLVPRSNGYQPGELFSLDLVAPKKEGTYIFSFADYKVLLNDGLGTDAKASALPVSIIVNKSASVTTSTNLHADVNPPEEFLPFLSNDPNIFDGKWFISFSASDKGSGVRSYAVFESRVSKNVIDAKDWVPASSPYVLKDQSLKSYLYLKAIDVAGNERIVRIAPSGSTKTSSISFSLYSLYAILIAIVVAFIGFLIHRKRSS